MRHVVVLGVLLLGGCMLDRSGLAGPDASASRDAALRDASGARDGAPGDAGPGVDAATDAGVPDGMDAGPDGTDAGPPDAGPPDAGPPDAGPPDAGPICVPADEACDAIDNDCDGTIDEGDACGCPAVTREGSVYLFCGGGRSWDDARAFCQERGYDLAVLRTMAEEDWVWEQTRTRSGDVDTWIGLGDRDTEGDYRWLDGTLIWSGGAAVSGEHNNWRGGGPDEVEAEDCVELDDGGGQWADEACGVSAPFVCEAPAP